jgi:multiple sugar transport system permease protein
VTGFIAHFQVFGQSYIMTGGGPGTASYTVIIYLFQVAWRYLRAGYGSAIAVALALIMIAITIVQFVFFGRRADQ